MTYRRHYAVLISVITHLLILVIPISSIVLSRQFKEVELFVLDEPTKGQKPKLIKSPPSPKQAVSEPQPAALVKPEPQIIEPSVTAPSQEAQIMVPEAKPQVETPKVVTSAAPTTSHQAPAPKPMLDVQFGSPNAPAFVHREMPVYPLIARRLGKEGKVLLRLTIDEKGRLLNVEVLEDAGYGFADAAVEAVKKSTFKPAMQDGKAVMSKALLPIRFSLRRD